MTAPRRKYINVGVDIQDTVYVDIDPTENPALVKWADERNPAASSDFALSIIRDSAERLRFLTEHPASDHLDRAEVGVVAECMLDAVRRMEQAPKDDKQ